MTTYERNKNVQWTVPSREDGRSTEQCILCVLMDIRDELQEIKSLARCSRIPKALDAAVRIDKRLAKKVKLP